MNRDFNITVKARAARDPDFAYALIDELIAENMRLRAFINDNGLTLEEEECD